MPKTPNKDKWKSNIYLNAYCYNRNGVVYTSINHQRRSTNLKWVPENKKRAIELLNDRVASYNPNSKRISDLYILFRNLHFNKLSIERKAQVKLSMKTFITEDYYCTEHKQISQMIIKNLQKTKLAYNTIKLRLGIIRQIFNLGIEYGYCSINPVRLSLFPNPEFTKVPSFSESEVEMLLENTKGTELARLIKFLSLTGLRISEALAITEKDIFDDHFIIHGKGNRDRVFPLDAVPLVKKYLAPFTIKNSTARYQLFKAMKELNLYQMNMGFHSLRKFAINTYIQNGVSVVLASNLFGHKVEIMEKYYLDVLGHKKLNELLKKELNNTHYLHNTD